MDFSFPHSYIYYFKACGWPSALEGLFQRKIKFFLWEISQAGINTLDHLQGKCLIFHSPSFMVCYEQSKLRISSPTFWLLLPHSTGISLWKVSGGVWLCLASYLIFYHWFLRDIPLKEMHKLHGWLLIVPLLVFLVWKNGRIFNITHSSFGDFLD